MSLVGPVPPMQRCNVIFANNADSNRKPLSGHTLRDVKGDYDFFYKVKPIKGKHKAKAIDASSAKPNGVPKEGAVVVGKISRTQFRSPWARRALNFKVLQAESTIRRAIDEERCQQSESDIELSWLDSDSTSEDADTDT